MSTVTIPLSPIVDLSEALAAIPVEAKPFLKQGFVALARLPDEKYLDLLTVAAELLVSRHLRPPPLGMASSRFGVPEQEIPALLAAANVVVSVFSARDDTPQQFVQTAIQAGILGEANRGPALALSELALKNRAPLNQVMERVRLGMTVLPSLAHLSTTVDVRPSVSQGRVSFAIPIALVYLRTDVGDHQIWLQLTKSQLEEVIKDLGDTLRRLEQVEHWIQKASSSTE